MIMLKCLKQIQNDSIQICKDLKCDGSQVCNHCNNSSHKSYAPPTFQWNLEVLVDTLLCRLTKYQYFTHSTWIITTVKVKPWCDSLQECTQCKGWYRLARHGSNATWMRMVLCMFIKYGRVASTNCAQPAAMLQTAQQTTFCQFLRQTQRDSLRSWGAFGAVWT